MDLKTLRLSRRLSQIEVAQRVGVSQCTVSRWKCGELIPHAYQATALADALHVRFAVMKRIFKKASMSDNRPTVPRLRILYAALDQARATLNAIQAAIDVAEQQEARACLTTVGIEIDAALNKDGRIEFGSKSCVDPCNKFGVCILEKRPKDNVCVFCRWAQEDL